MEAGKSVNAIPWEVVERVISPHRLESYLRDSVDRRELALALYEWNNELSAAFWELISLLEVGLRNTIDQKLEERSRRLGRDTHWIFDESGELGRRDNAEKNLYPYRDIYSAIGRVRRNEKPVSPQQIISETSLGFWHQLVSSKSLSIWPDIAGAFPYAPSRDQSYIAELVQDLRKLRNRISHHHKLQAKSIERGELLILELAKAIDPEFSIWLKRVSKIEIVLHNRPTPGKRVKISLARRLKALLRLR